MTTNILHAIDQADLALGTSGLAENNIFRRELRDARASVESLLATRHDSNYTQEEIEREIAWVEKLSHRPINGYGGLKKIAEMLRHFTTPPHPTEVGKAVACLWGVAGNTGELWMTQGGMAYRSEQEAEDFITWASEYRKDEGPYTIVPLYTHPAPAAVDDDHSEDSLDMVANIAEGKVVVDKWKRFDPRNPPPFGTYLIYDKRLLPLTFQKHPMPWTYRKDDVWPKGTWFNENNWVADIAPEWYRDLPNLPPEAMLNATASKGD